MIRYSTRQAAKKLGITQAALSKYLKAKKVPAPEMITSGRLTLHLWTEKNIEEVRKLLPNIKNGRKTRYKKKKNTQLGTAVPHKQRQKKKQ